MATSISAGQHVPAWKRLGLKLKYAKDTPSEVISPSSVQAKESLGDNVHLGKRARESENDVGTPKRSKVSTEHEQVPIVNNTDSSRDATTVLAAPKGRRKSVTFTSDTKQDDGFSATTLYQNWLANEHEAQSSFQPHEQSHDPGHDTIVQKLEPTPAKPGKKPKSVKSKSKTDKAAKAAREKKQPANGEVPDFVKYLVQFHQDKSAWKFHKKKQNELIKHCFDLDRIPAKHTPALVEYVKGLQSAGVQQRLVESSEKILQDLLAGEGRSSEIDGMESAQARKVAYEAVVQRQTRRVEELGGAKSEYETQRLAEMERKAAMGDRALAIVEVSLLNYLGRPVEKSKLLNPSTLPAVAQAPDGMQQTPYQNMISRAAPKRTTFADDDADTPATEQPEHPTKRRKSRKSRTNVAEDSSSSSEEDSTSDSGSSSSSDDDDDDGNDGRTAQSKMPKSNKKPIFDKELLDAAFPGSQARSHKARALAETRTHIRTSQRAKHHVLALEGASQGRRYIGRTVDETS
nr:uncharacterized protein c7orf50 like [Quercus suber]